MKEIQKKDTAEIKKFVAEKREELRTLRFGTSGSGMRNTKSMRNTRKEVARSLTELRRREKEALTDGA